MKEKHRRQWTKSRAELMSATWPVAFAFAFWAIMVLLIIFAVATAAKKGNPFTDFFIAFGAVGQVAFAFMVWKLSREQFAFTKSSTERQTRIDTYSIRKEILDRFLGLYAVAEKAENGQAYEANFIEEWYNLVGESELVFSGAVATPLLELAARLHDLIPDSAYFIKIALETNGDMAAQNIILRQNWKEISSLRFAVWHAMYLEITLTSA